MSQGARRDRCFRRLIQGCVRFGNLDLDLKIRISDLRSNAISKRIPTLRYLFLDFHLYRSIGKSEKRFEKLSLRTAVLTLFTITVLQILLRWNPHLDFLIEIHREDEFLGGEIRFRISRLIAKSETRISNLNPYFPVERNLWCTLHLLMATASTKANNVVTSKQQHNNNV